jgi:hypothetical protein
VLLRNHGQETEESRKFEQFPHLIQWMEGVRGLPDFHEVNYEF